MDNIVIWGAGNYTKEILTQYYFPLELIEMIIDSDKTKYGCDYFGMKIYAPSSLADCKSNIVLIGSLSYYLEIVSIIKNMNPDMECKLLGDYFKENFVDRHQKTSCTYSLIEYKKMIHEIGMIPKDCLQSAALLGSRYEAIKMLPKGGVIGEVGVAYGDFSEYLIEELKPIHFYAIDFFQGGEVADFWGRTDIVTSGLNHEGWYRKRFESLIPDIMSIMTGYSWECLNSLPDDTFDFLYIDASHEYKDIKKDIDAAVRKVKNGGIIQFNDYTIWDICDSCCYGVIPAVNEFIRDTKSQILYYCFQEWGFDDIVVRLKK